MRKTRSATILTVTLLLFLSVWMSGEKAADGQTQPPPDASVLSHKLAQKSRVLSHHHSGRLRASARNQPPGRISRNGGTQRARRGDHLFPQYSQHTELGCNHIQWSSGIRAENLNRCGFN